ncbi:MAG: TolC family protein [Nitrospirota bacterium]
MKRIFIVSVFFFMLFHHAFAEVASDSSDPAIVRTEYTLEDLYAIALERSERVGIARQNLSIAERGKEKAVSSLLPRATAFGDYTRYSEEKKASGDEGGFTIQPESSSSWGMRLDQSISLGGRELTNLRISKEAIESSRYDLYTIREDYVLTVAASFYDVLSASKAVDISKANVQRLTKYRDDATTRLKVGEVTKTAVLRAEAELSGAQSDLIRAENVLSLAKAVLARIVGLQGDFDLRETNGAGDITASSTGGLEQLSALKDEAIRERSDLKSARLQELIAKDQVKYAKGSYWPTLSFEGVYLQREEEPSSSFFNDESTYGILRLEFPFFEGGLRKAEVGEAQARKMQARLSHDDLRKTVAIDVETAYLELKTQIGTLKSLEDQLKFARENYDAVSKQFTFGLATSIDVIDANTLLLESERQLIRAQYGYKLALLKLQRATGTLLKTVNSKQ